MEQGWGGPKDGSLDHLGSIGPFIFAQFKLYLYYELFKNIYVCYHLFR